MSNNGIPIYIKILYSILFPLLLLFHCVLFLIGKNKQEKIWWNTIIYNIREEYDKDSFTVIGYSFFPLMLLFITYIMGRVLHWKICTSSSTIINTILKVIQVWGWKPDIFFPIVLAIGALLVSIIIALTLKKKSIESGTQFMDQLYIHINYLKHIQLKNGEKYHILYIITPNINIGTGINYSFATAIENNKNIFFKFICKTIDDNVLKEYPEGGDISDVTVAEKKRAFFNKSDKTKNSMLQYLYMWYHNDLRKLEASIVELNKILDIKKKKDGNVDIIEKYDDIYSNKEIGGYLSDKECLLGLYEKIKVIKAEEKKIVFRGETVVSSEFIEIIKEYIEEKIK